MDADDRAVLVSHDALVRIEARLSRIETSLKTLARLMIDEAISGQDVHDPNLGTL